MITLTLNVGLIREDFPLIRNRGLIYLDNAATTQKPIQVIEAVRNYYIKFNANVHRGLYELSQEASELYEEAHEVVAKFINAGSWEEVVFTRNATEGINILAQALINKYLKSGDEVIISIMEHHSNMLPWIKLSEAYGVKVKVVGINSDGLLDYDELSNILTSKTKVISITHASNVLGTLNDVRKIAKLGHEVNALVIIDGAQSVPHLPVNVRELDIDFMVFSGHKMLGPTGIGVLWGRKDLLEDLPPVLQGGGMIKYVGIEVKEGVLVSHRIVYNDLPWKFEAGTPNIAGGIGLAEAVNYLTRLGMEEVRTHEVELTRYALRRLDEALKDDVKILGPRYPELRSGLISMAFRGLNPHVIASLISTKNIAVRSGYHCAQPLHEYLGVKDGTLRASFYIYNDVDDVDIFINTLEEVINTLNK